MAEVSVDDLYRPTETDAGVLKDPEVAHLTIHANKIISSRVLPGLHVDVEELKDGIDAKIVLDENTVIEKPVHFCFGMLPQEGLQRIILDVDIRKGAKITLLAHCVFPNAVNVKHVMDAKIRIGEGAEYIYFERHIHGSTGGVTVIPKAVIHVGKDARFKSEFELVKGRVGVIDIDYEGTCEAGSSLEMIARINGTGDDLIKIYERCNLVGDYARGVLTSKIAVRDNARAEINNKMTASAAYARGHVDCKEIVQDNAVATAVPIVEVTHPKAHVTHEAAIGSVDSKQLQTLMARGLSEDDAVDLIIDGLLS